MGRVVILGSGTSHGVPMVGCECATCQSDDGRDRRSRPSIFIELPGGFSLLVDTSPDLRAQALKLRLNHVDAILYTHGHADHVLGLDEVRRFNVLQRAAIPCYGDRRTLTEIRRMFSYIFDRETPAGGGIPQVVLFPLEGEFCAGRTTVVPVPVLHGARPVYGYRLGTFAYLTDCSAIPDASWPLLSGVQTLVIDALRDRPHPTHFSVTEALEVVQKLSPKQAYFTHICHDLPHAATCARLPDGVELAYDGLSFEFEL